MKVYRPIGLEWFIHGHWGINDNLDTAKQFLGYDQEYRPEDGTPPLNHFGEFDPQAENGVHIINDPGGDSVHMACTLRYFIDNKFDILIASIPSHIPIFKDLIKKYQPQAKLIIQVGNNWNIHEFEGENVLASTQPTIAPGVNTMFYHQEFDLDIFKPTPVEPSKKIYSFVNIIQNTGQGWNDYQNLKKQLSTKGYYMAAYGGQCPDGNMTGPKELADKMREAMLIYHVKPGGDGFGHIIHNAYAVGRPIITRASDYHNQLAMSLLVPGTYIDLDKYSVPDVRNMITKLEYAPEELIEMGQKAANRFRQVVDYEKEAEDVRNWVDTL